MNKEIAEMLISDLFEKLKTASLISQLRVFRKNIMINGMSKEVKDALLRSSEYSKWWRNYGKYLIKKGLGLDLDNNEFLKMLDDENISEDEIEAYLILETLIG